MREPLFRTRITELLGIRHPILCGGMGPGVSDARYVAAVVNAGGMGFIMALGWGTTGRLPRPNCASAAQRPAASRSASTYTFRGRPAASSAPQQQIRVMCEEKVSLRRNSRRKSRAA